MLAQAQARGLPRDALPLVGQAWADQPAVAGPAWEGQASAGRLLSGDQVSEAVLQLVVDLAAWKSLDRWECHLSMSPLKHRATPLRTLAQARSHCRSAEERGE